MSHDVKQDYPEKATSTKSTMGADHGIACP